MALEAFDFQTVLYCALTFITIFLSFLSKRKEIGTRGTNRQVMVKAACNRAVFGREVTKSSYLFGARLKAQYLGKSFLFKPYSLDQ